jgi:GTP cyclohydrolase II
VFGHIEGAKSVPVRVHPEELISDVFGQRALGQTNLMSKALARIDQSRIGVVVYLREGTVGVHSPTLRAIRRSTRLRSGGCSRRVANCSKDGWA